MVNEVTGMGSRRVVQPVAGALLCLGAGYAVVALDDPDSETRQRISKRASEIRTEVLLRILSKRLQPAGLLCNGETESALPPSAVVVEHAEERDPPIVHPPFYVVTGPDDWLTSLARERVAARAGLVDGGNAAVARTGGGAHDGLSSYSGQGGTRVDNVERPAVRFGVPYGCTLGSGELSSLMEQQLLRQPRAVLVDDGRGDGGVSSAAEQPALRGEGGQDDAERGLDFEEEAFGRQQQQERHHSSTGWGAAVDKNDGDLDREEGPESPPPASATATRQTTSLEVISNWDSFLLWLTSAVLYGPQLDSTALVALERVLAESHPAGVAGDTRSSPGDSSTDAVDDGSADRTDVPESLQPASHGSPPVPPNAAFSRGGSGCNLVLEIGRPASREGQEGERENPAEKAIDEARRMADGSEAGGLCGDLARWGWKLASRRLATVVVSSSNPWVLAELQQALQETTSSYEENLTERSTPHQEKVSGEAVVVRVALTSAAQREQEVLSVAGELGLDDGRLSAADVSAVAELTGGRHDAVLAVLSRVKKDHSAAATLTLAEACQAAVDDQARDLATAWGLLQLPRDGDSSLRDDRAATLADISAGSGEAGSGARTASATGSSGMGPGELGAANAAAAVAAAAAAAARRGDRGKKSRKDWAPLWEAMGMLSVPSVAVGAVAAGATSAASTPFGTAHPAELLEECALDGVTLLRLTSEGWLELSPAVPQASGTVLGDTELFNPSEQRDKPHRGLPSITVHTATIPLDYLSRGVDRSLVGAPPLRLAAFRRLVDGHRRWWTTAMMSPTTGRREQRARGDKDHGAGDGGNQEAGAGERNREMDGGSGTGGWHSRGGEVAGDYDRAGAGGAEREPNHGADAAHLVRADARGTGETDPSWTSSTEGTGAESERELERAGCLIEAAVLGRLLEREEAKLTEDGALLSSNWSDLGTARRDLEREGRGEDVSDGEWAELQLELIRQERAVVARASEMRTRRGRLNSLRRDILGLEKRAALLPSSPTAPQLTPPPSKDPKELSWENSGAAGEVASLRGGFGGDRWGFSGFAEEAVMRDAETGVRLRPLRSGNEDGGDAIASSSSSSRAVERGVDGNADRGRGESWRGLGVRRLWRWVRGST